MFTETSAAFIKDLRFALEVMEDRSHLGLDPERATKLRDLMQRRISAAEETFTKLPEKIAPTATTRKQSIPA
jgi:hypothetical protein